MTPRLAWLYAALLLSVSLAGSATAGRRASPPPSPTARLQAELAAVVRVYRQWGITFEWKKDADLSQLAGSPLSVTGGVEGDTVTMGVDVGVGRQGVAGMSMNLAGRMAPGGGSMSLTGKVFGKGAGIGGDVSYTPEDGWVLAPELEEMFWSIKTRIGGDGKSPIKVALRNLPFTIELDPLQFARRARLMLPKMGAAAKEKVGGVLIRVDLDLLAAALVKAPLPLSDEVRGLRAVSLRRLLDAVRAGKTVDLAPLTSVRGVVVDAPGKDIQLLGVAEPGQPAVTVTHLVALLRSVWLEGRQSFVSLDPDPTNPAANVPRIGGVSPGLEKSALLRDLLEADYRLKSVIFGDVRMPGVSSLPEALLRRTGAGAVAGRWQGRFWFAPRAIEPGDISVSRSTAGTVVRFNSVPEVLAERDLSTDPVAAAANDPGLAAAREVVAGLTRSLPALEQAHANLGLKPLRQAFELSTAASILRLEKLPAPCSELLRKLAALPLEPIHFREDFPTITRKAEVPGTARAITVWGGVNAAVDVEGVTFRPERSLSRLLAPAGAAPWKGWSRPCRAGFEPIVLNEVPIALADLAQSRVVRAGQSAKTGNYESVLAEAAAALRIDPQSSEAGRLRCLALHRLGRPDELLAESTAWVQRVPNDWRAHAWRAAAHLDLFRPEESRDDAAQAVRLAPRESLPYSLRGDARRLLGDYTGAVADLTEAIRLSPDAGFLYQSRAAAWRGAKNNEKAIEDYTRFLAFEPRNAGALKERAALYRDISKPQLSLQDYQRLVELEPTPEHLGSLAVARLDLDDPAGALADVNRAIRMHPVSERLYAIRSLVYRERREYRAAIEDLDRALRWLPAAGAAQLELFGPVYRTQKRELERLLELQMRGLEPGPRE